MTSPETLGRQFSVSEHVVGMVPVDTLLKMPMVDRSVDPIGGEQKMSELQDSLVKHGALEQLTVGWDPETNRASLSEGNHRVVAAHRAGITHLPVTVVNRYRGGKSMTLTPLSSVRSGRSMYFYHPHEFKELR